MPSASFRLIAAPHTPCRDDGALAEDRVAAQARFLRGLGVDGVFVAGTTGEGPSFDRDERQRLAAAWAKAARAEGLGLWIHVGADALGDAWQLAAHAAELRADGIAALAPRYFRPRTVDELVDWLAAIAEAAPRVPFLYYDIPAFTGVALPTAEVMVACRERLRSFGGVKFTNPDLAELQRCLAVAAPGEDVLFGTDEALLAAAALGCSGAVGSSYGFAAPLYRCALAAQERGEHEESARWQRRAIAWIDALVAHGYLRSAKATVGMLGCELGPVRAPLRPLTSAQRDALRRDLDALGVRQWLDEARRASVRGPE